MQFQVFSLQLLNIKSFKGILQDLWWLLLFYKTHFISCFCFYILYDIICSSLLCSLLFYSEIGVLQIFFCLVKVRRLQLKTFKIPLKALILTNRKEKLFTSIFSVCTASAEQLFCKVAFDGCFDFLWYILWCHFVFQLLWLKVKPFACKVVALSYDTIQWKKQIAIFKNSWYSIFIILVLFWRISSVRVIEKIQQLHEKTDIAVGKKQQYYKYSTQNGNQRG